MISLIKILKEHGEGEEYPPYMYSSVGFGCHVCEYLARNKDEDRWVCTNKEYQEYIGTHYLIDPETKEPEEAPKELYAHIIKDEDKWKMYQ
jgi:hypothetical protein